MKLGIEVDGVSIWVIVKLTLDIGAGWLNYCCVCLGIAKDGSKVGIWSQVLSGVCFKEGECEVDMDRVWINLG